MGLWQTLRSFAPLRRHADAGAAAADPLPSPDARTLMAELDTLASEGRLDAALRLAAAHAPRLDTGEVWDRLSTLRMERAAEAMRQARPRPDWPPALEDPRPGALLPEIEASDLDWRTLGGAVLHHGSLLVRNLVDGATAARLRGRIDASLDAFDAYRQDEAAGGSAYRPVRLGPDQPLKDTRGWSRAGGGVWAAEAPAVLDEMIGLYRGAGLLDAIARYLGETPLLSVGKTVLRRAEPAGADGFHQDGAFMGADIRTLNVWLALSDCGVDAPGLELVPARLPGLAETGTEGVALDWMVGRPVAERAAGGKGLVMPAFRAGDALVFDQLMLHSTGYRAGMDKRRYAVEAWFFAPSTAPRDQAPLAI